MAAAVDWQGTLVDEECFPTTRQDFRLLESWARPLGDVLRVGVECSGSYGSGLTRHLAKNGFAVLEVTFPDKTVRKKRDKDDFIDAEMAAEAAFTGARTVTPKSRDGMVEALRMLQKTRSTAVAARRIALQTIRANIISAPEELRGMTRMQLIRHLVATRPDSTGFRTPLGAARMALKRLAKRYIDLDDEVSELDDMIDAILADAAPLLVQLKCVGAQSAAQLMVTVGDNPERLRSEASFAMLCGVAPVPVSSGMTYRHRLNRGGDRQANAAIHIVAIGRLRTEGRTKEYVARGMSEGHTKMEAIRQRARVDFRHGEPAGRGPHGPHVQLVLRARRTQPAGREPCGARKHGLHVRSLHEPGQDPGRCRLGAAQGDAQARPRSTTARPSWAATARPTTPSRRRARYAESTARGRRDTSLPGSSLGLHKMVPLATAQVSFLRSRQEWARRPRDAG